MFYYTYNNEEDLYIHPQDPFRKKKHHTALTRLEHAQTVGEMNATDHTGLLFFSNTFGRWMFLNSTSASAELFFNRRFFLLFFFFPDALHEVSHRAPF